MACGDDMKTLLSRHVDGELAPEERARVEEHVAGCGPCRELLQIFQKNESILGNALSTESFGNTVIEGVINEIKREAQPVEAKPVDEGASEWFRSRPIIPLAAAALFVVGLIAVLSMSHNRNLDKMAANNKNLSDKVQSLTDIVISTSRGYEEAIARIRAQEAIQGAREGVMLATMTPHHLVVRGSFDLKIYGTYDVYRRSEGEANDRFKKMNADRRLDSPEYIDTSVKAGYGYVYKFRAYRSAKEDDFVESSPITMRMPRVHEIAAEWSIRVQCVDIGYSFKVAKFLLHRVINGRTVTEEFAIKPGEQLGEVRDIPGVGKVDFRTSLTLDRLEEGNQGLIINYTKAVLDENGNPHIVRFNDGTTEVKTEQLQGVLSIRPNFRAFFRTSGSTAADVDLWKGSWIQVRAQN